MIKKATESARTVKELCIKVSGRATNSMAKALIYGQTVDHHLVIGFKTKDMETKYSQMHWDRNLRSTGRMESKNLVFLCDD